MCPHNCLSFFQHLSVVVCIRHQFSSSTRVVVPTYLTLGPLLPCKSVSARSTKQGILSVKLNFWLLFFLLEGFVLSFLVSLCWNWGRTTHAIQGRSNQSSFWLLPIDCFVLNTLIPLDYLSLLIFILLCTGYHKVIWKCCLSINTYKEISFLSISN